MVDKSEILNTLNHYFDVSVEGRGPNIVIDDDGTVNILKRMGFTMEISVKRGIEMRHFPLHFGRVEYDFRCGERGLTSLEGGPTYVDGMFDCEFNQLTSLEGAPKIVTGSFTCKENPLENLRGAPETVGGDFVCNEIPLESLEGAPKTVGGGFYCGSNHLRSLKGCPESIGGKIWLRYNPELPLLRALVAKRGIGLQGIGKYPYAVRIEEVLNQFAGQGKRGVPACMVALNNLQKETGTDISGNMKW